MPPEAAQVQRGALLVELATGNVHAGPARDFLPPWKVDELARASGPLEVRWPSERPDPIVERIFGLARTQAPPATHADQERS